MAKKRGNRGKFKQPQNVNKSSLADTINSEVIAEALTSVINQNQPILMKVCRLCETKDGPFLNIFDAEKVTAKKIDDLMPFSINEYDDLPHKICFRCSAKVEELYEFVQKCVKTQNNLRDSVGKGPVPIKTKTRKQWEQKLNQSNMSNDDICESLIKKAMEGVFKPDLPEVVSQKDTDVSESPLKKSSDEAEVPIKKTKPTRFKNEQKDDDYVADVPEKQIKNGPENTTSSVRSTRSKIADAFNDDTTSTSSKKSSNEIEVEQPIETKKTKSSAQTKSNSTIPPKAQQNIKSKLKDEKVNLEKDKIQANQTEKNVLTTNIFSLGEGEKEDEKKDKFNIMDHVSMIKVNGVGVLFQCKLCNRNFLKEDVVKTHSCAKNGPKLTEKIDLTKSMPAPEPPKAPTVKYINTKNHEPNRANDIADKSMPFSKPKPKIGPASKTKRDFEGTDVVIGKVDTTKVVKSSGRSPVSSSLQIPGAPSLNSRYKLVPGPNNTFTLVEEPTTAHVQDNTTITKTKNVVHQVTEPSPTMIEPVRSKNKKTVIQPVAFKNMIKENPVPTGQPYPVGLFQTVPHPSGVFCPPVAEPITFTTPAMKKQSYTIVQTGNPSKLLISTKPPTEAAEEPEKKRQKKNKQDTKFCSDVKKPLYTATVQEEIVPEKNEGFFSFINVDPLVDSSYVLPTDSIIQESQITTSSSVAKSKEEEHKYSCNMCGEKFSREKKLLAHIQSHYKKMDMEDKQRSETLPKKRGRKPTKQILG